MDYRMKVLVGLIFLALVDAVIPVPVIGLILMYVIFAKPDSAGLLTKETMSMDSWFSDLVAQIYGRAGGGG